MSAHAHLLLHPVDFGNQCDVPGVHNLLLVAALRHDGVKRCIAIRPYADCQCPLPSVLISPAHLQGILRNVYLRKRATAREILCLSRDEVLAAQVGWRRLGVADARSIFECDDGLLAVAEGGRAGLDSQGRRERGEQRHEKKIQGNRQPTSTSRITFPQSC